jgi:cytochrome P450
LSEFYRLLAGIDTTSDALTYLIWQLSLPENAALQTQLIKEVTEISIETLNADGLPTVAATDKLPYLNALIKETLRLHAPIPGPEPRSQGKDCVINGYPIPARTVVVMAPYTLHRHPQAFPNAEKFDPDRWLGNSEEVMERNRWWWAFSSGGRTCIGMQ